MKTIFHPLTLAALLTVSANGFAQTPAVVTPAAGGTERPLNLSLPRSDVPAVNWEHPEVPPEPRDESKRSDKEKLQGSRRAGGLPYGSGFEARHGSGMGGRGMGRGR